MKTFERLQKRLKDDLNLDVENIHRTNAGHWQKAAGAFVWEGILKDSMVVVGSCNTAKDCISGKNHLELNTSYLEIEIFAEKNE